MHLDKLSTFHGCPGPLLLVVMDGVGVAPAGPANAVGLARTPVLDALLASRYRTNLHAHGTHVGLASDAEMGNSEVGHNALGGGRVFEQGAKLVKRAIDEGALFDTDAWGEVMARGVAGCVHFLGLLSDGNVHAHIDHLLALLTRCAQSGVKSARVHVLLDGRDVAPRSALEYLRRLEKHLADINRGDGFEYRIASGGGRMAITMDRYQADWGMVKKGFDAHVHGIGQATPEAEAEVRRQYAADADLNDQFLAPFVVVGEDGAAVGKMRDGDAVVLFNFRGDRAIEISRALEDDDFDAFDRGPMPAVLFCGMLQYDGDLLVPKRYLVEPPAIDRTMIEFLCAENIKTFAVSETHKFGHVTYFWNGNRSAPISAELETWVEVPSDLIEPSRVPAMQADAVAEAAIELLRSGEYRFGRVNFANADMVGHSGNIEATIRAVEAVDAALAKLLAAAAAVRGTLIVTADHGNADEMFVEKNGQRIVRTAHSLNAVPFVIVDAAGDAEVDNEAYRMAKITDPGLAHVAATVFNLLGFRAPEDYMPSLLEFPGEPHRRRAIHHGAVVNLGLETVKLPNDELMALEIVRHPGGAVVVAQDAQQRLGLLRQFRHAAGGWIWEFPAGMLEPHETPLQAAQRELREETGCSAAAWQTLGETMPAPGFCTERLYIFHATDLTLAAAEPQDDEFIELHWKPLPEITAMAKSGEINDAKTIVALFRMAAAG